MGETRDWVSYFSVCIVVNNRNVRMVSDVYILILLFGNYCSNIQVMSVKVEE